MSIFEIKYVVYFPVYTYLYVTRVTLFLRRKNRMFTNENKLQTFQILYVCFYVNIVYYAKNNVHTQNKQFKRNVMSVN